MRRIVATSGLGIPLQASAPEELGRELQSKGLGQCGVGGVSGGTKRRTLPQLDQPQCATRRDVLESPNSIIVSLQRNSPRRPVGPTCPEPQEGHNFVRAQPIGWGRRNACILLARSTTTCRSGPPPERDDFTKDRRPVQTCQAVDRRPGPIRQHEPHQLRSGDLERCLPHEESKSHGWPISEAPMRRRIGKGFVIDPAAV